MLSSITQTVNSDTDKGEPPHSISANSLPLLSAVWGPARHAYPHSASFTLV